MKILITNLRNVRANIRTFEKFGCLDDGMEQAKEKEAAINAAIKEWYEK
jgi:hypothetical protein